MMTVKAGLEKWDGLPETDQLHANIVKQYIVVRSAILMSATRTVKHLEKTEFERRRKDLSDALTKQKSIPGNKKFDVLVISVF